MEKVKRNKANCIIASKIRAKIIIKTRRRIKEIRRGLKGKIS